MSESNLYKEGGTITTSNVNKRNAELAQEYKDKVANAEKAAIYADGAKQGASKAYEDVVQRLAASNQYTPIMEGSPEDLRMQDNINRGINYGEPVVKSEPGLLDMLEGKLDNAANWVTSAFSQEPAPVVNNHEQFAEADRNSLMEAIHDHSFRQAKEMGDTSEENINRLITENLQREGL